MTHFQAFFPTTKHLWLYCIILSYDWLSSTINIHFWPMSALYCGSLVTGHLFDMCKRARLHCWQTHQTLCWSTECITMCYNAHMTLDCQTAKKTYVKHLPGILWQALPCPNSCPYGRIMMCWWGGRPSKNVKMGRPYEHRHRLGKKCTAAFQVVDILHDLWPSVAYVLCPPRCDAMWETDRQPNRHNQGTLLRLWK